MSDSSNERVVAARLYHLLAEQACEHAIILLGLDGRIIGWSDGAERLFGYAREQILGEPFTRIFTESDRLRGLAELEIAIAASGAISEDDRWHVRADGSRFWATGSLTALRDATGTLLAYGKIVRDRTNLKEQIELLTRQRDSAAAQARNTEVVITTLSHELKNLLASLTHSLRTLREPAVPSERRDTVAQLMEEQVNVVRRLTDDLLDVERVRIGKVSLELAPVDLRQVVAKAVDAANPRLPDKQLRLDSLVPPGPLVVAGDAARLYQVFVNLIDNAIKYTPGGGRIWIKMTTEDSDAIVHIEDSGRGIPPDMLLQIFDLFTQVETGTPQHGLGIGLALVKELVSLHGGSVQARSEGLGKGSEFTVRLPLRCAS